MAYAIYQVRVVDALCYEDEGWVYNDSMPIGTMRVNGEPSVEECKTALLDWLAEKGYDVLSDCDVDSVDPEFLEVQLKATGEPVFCAEMKILCYENYLD